jgi:hypothetical protein
VRELENFRVKITESANEGFGAWRAGQHDDLVLSRGLAVWRGESLLPPLVDPPRLIHSPVDAVRLSWASFAEDQPASDSINRTVYQAPTGACINYNST